MSVRRKSRINVKALVILVVVVAVLLGAAAVGYKIRKRLVAERALVAGQAAFERQDWPEACKQLKKYLVRYPDDPEILARYAEAHLAVRPRGADNVGAAIGAYRRYLRHSPGEEKAHHKLAKLYLDIRDFEEAEYIASQRLSRAPDDADATIIRARALIGLGRLDEARTQCLEPLVEARPDQVDAYLLLSDIARQSRDGGPEEALRWLDLAVTNNPTSAHALLSRAALHRQLARWPRMAQATPPPTSTHDEASLVDLEAADALRPQDPHLLAFAFDLWLDRGNLEKAELELEALEQLDDQALAAVDVEPQLARFIYHTAAGRLALRRAAKEEAAAVADKGLASLSGAERVSFLETAAELYLAADRLESAQQCLAEFRSAVDAHVSGDAALTERLSVLEAAIIVKDPAANPFEAIARLREITIVNPRNAQAWKLLADAYIRTEQPLRALTALEQRVRRVLDDRESALMLAGIYVDMQPRRAIQVAARIEELHPDDLQARLVRLEAEIETLRRGGTDVDRNRLARELADLRASHPASTQVRVLVARLALAERRTEEALAELRQAAAEGDDTALAAAQLATCAQEHGRPEEALDAARQAVALTRDLAAPKLQLAWLHEQQGRPDEARHVLEQAAAELKGTERMRARFALAGFQVSHGPRDQGITTLRQMAAEHPQNWQLRRALLGLPEIRANTIEAQKLVDELRALEGEKAVLWPVEQVRLWLDGELSSQREQKAIDLLTQALHAGAADYEPVLMLGDLYYLKRGDAEKAEAVYRRALDEWPLSIPVADKLLTLLESQGRFREASAVLERLPREVAVFHKHRIKVGEELGDLDAVIADLQQRVARDPHDAASRLTLARLTYAQNHDAQTALAWLDEAERLSPDLPGLLAARVRILLEEGRHDEAQTLLDVEVARRNDFETYQLRAGFHEAAGRLEPAEKDYRRLTSFEDSVGPGYLALGRFYGRIGRADQSIAAAEAGLKRAPGDRGLRRLLAAALASQPGSPERQRGFKMIGELLEETPNDTDLLLLRARFLLARREPGWRDQAVADLERVVSLEPRNAPAHLHLVDLARAEGNTTLLGQRLNTALRAIPDNPHLLLAQAVFAADSGDMEVARSVAQGIVDHQEAHVPALNLLAHLALRNGDVDSADRYNARSLAADPTNEAANLARAEIWSALNRLDEAINVAEAYRKSEAGGKSVSAALTLAGLYIRANRFDDANRAIDEAHELAPASPPVLRARLEWLTAQRRFDEVAELASNPPVGTTDVLDLQELAASMLASSGESSHLNQASRLCHRIVAAEPGRVGAWVTLGQVAAMMGDHLTEAKDAYRTALKLAPDHPQALNNLAWILGMQESQLDEALQLATRGVNRHPGDPHLRETRAAIRGRLGQFREAEEDLERCLQLVRDKPMLRRTQVIALHRSAKVLLELGQAEDARKRQQDALQITQQLTEADRQEIERALQSLEQ